LRAGEQPPKTPAAPSPTHLLCGALALPLGDGVEAADHPACSLGAAGFRVERRAGGMVIAPAAHVTHNGVRIDAEQPAAAGDLIVCGDAEFRLIATVDG